SIAINTQTSPLTKSIDRNRACVVALAMAPPTHVCWRSFARGIRNGNSRYANGARRDGNGAVTPVAGRSRLKRWMFVAAIWLWPAVFNVVTRVAQTRLQGWDPPTTPELIFEFGDWFAYAIVTPLIFKVSERWPVTRSRLVRRFLVHLGFALLFCV